MDDALVKIILRAYGRQHEIELPGHHHREPMAINEEEAVGRLVLTALDAMFETAKADERQADLFKVDA